MSYRYAALNFISNLKFNTSICIIILSLSNVLIISGHLIGSCQLYFLYTNIYVFLFYLISTLCNCYKLYEFDYLNSFTINISNHFMFCHSIILNILMMSSLMCIVGNTEDDIGVSSYEIASIFNSITWSLQLNHIIIENISLKINEFGDVADNDFLDNLDENNTNMYEYLRM